MAYACTAPAGGVAQMITPKPAGDDNMLHVAARQASKHSNMQHVAALGDGERPITADITNKSPQNR